MVTNTLGDKFFFKIHKNANVHFLTIKVNLGESNGGPEELALPN